MATYGVNEANERIKRNSARGLTFWKMVGIHLNAIPEEQAFIEVARKEHSDINLLANNVVTNHGKGAKAIWTWDDPKQVERELNARVQCELNAS